jgi:hypothetical protein
MAQPGGAMDFARAPPVVRRMRAPDHLARRATGRYWQDGKRIESAPADSRTVLILYARSHTALILSAS